MAMKLVPEYLHRTRMEKREERKAIRIFQILVYVHMMAFFLFAVYAHHNQEYSGRLERSIAYSTSLEQRIAALEYANGETGIEAGSETDYIECEVEVPTEFKSPSGWLLITSKETKGKPPVRVYVKFLNYDGETWELDPSGKWSNTHVSGYQLQVDPDGYWTVNDYHDKKGNPTKTCQGTHWVFTIRWRKDPNYKREETAAPVASLK